MPRTVMQPKLSKTGTQGNKNGPQQKFFDLWKTAVHEGSMTPVPQNIQLIGNEVAIVWSDGHESYYPMEFLRAQSPSAENKGERDIFGNRYGGGGPSKFPGVTVIGWDYVGGYACRFEFSDGHRTGLYSFSYLRDLEKLLS